MPGFIRGLGQVVGTLVKGAGMVLRGETRGQVLPAEGSRAPAFSVTAHDGSTVTLEQFRGRKHVVLFFYPKADTPG